MPLPDRRVLFVTGKGGVGKTTVAAALALGASRAGRRVLLCETAGARRVPALWGQTGRGYEVTTLAPRLETMSISSAEAIEEHLVAQLHFRRLYKLVFRNRVMGPFLDAVPGLHDLIQLGKVFDLERARPGWDLLVIDGPATGHALAMLEAPRSMMELTVAGPFHDNARDVAALFEDAARVALIVVAGAEELPVNETVDLHRRLGRRSGQIAAVVLNEVHARPLPDAALFREHAACFPADVRAVAEAALAREERQVAARARLQALGPPLVELPWLGRRDLGPADLGRLAEGLS
jgi:anion-transporting  ArsA/GET3 family ATPase